MSYSEFQGWISRKIIPLGRLTRVTIDYLTFLMTPTRKHTLEAAARFSNSSKSKFNNFLENHPNKAVYALSDLSKKQARQFSKAMKGLANNKLPWNIAILVDSTFLRRSSLHTENAKRFNHGKGFVIGHQWTNILLLMNDKVIPLPPIPFYTKDYCKKYGETYETENTRVVKYLTQLSLEEYIGPHMPEKVVVLADSGYDDHKIQEAIARRDWKFIIALKSSRSVKIVKKYLNSKKPASWNSIAVAFNRDHRIGWVTIRVPKDSEKKKRMEFRVKQIMGYVRKFGKAQLICSEFKKRSMVRKKYLACNDMKATPRQIIIGYRLRWRIEIFHKEVKMFLGFEDVSSKWFSSVISHVHWVYCAYILLSAGPPGVSHDTKSLAEKQLMIHTLIQKRDLSRLNQVLTRINGVQSLKIDIKKALESQSGSTYQVFQGLAA